MTKKSFVNADSWQEPDVEEQAPCVLSMHLLSPAKYPLVADAERLVPSIDGTMLQDSEKAGIQKFTATSPLGKLKLRTSTWPKYSRI